MNRIARALLVFVCISCAACGRQSEEAAPVAEGPDDAPAASSPGSATEGSAEISAAIASTERLEGDREQDAWRNPQAVLAFLQVQPGQHVVDYLAAGGYYTELLSRVVGPQGRVIAYNNEPYLKYSGEQPARRYGENRLPNVVQLTAAPETAQFEPDSLDAALFVQSYHDLYWRSKDGSWPVTDPAKALAALVPALKSGAVVVVVDHVAAPGSDPAVDVDALHRIDPALVKRDFEAAGLVLDAESDAFANPQDDHTRPVFDETIRRKTDQMMLRFRKP